MTSPLHIPPPPPPAPQLLAALLCLLLPSELLALKKDKLIAWTPSHLSFSKCLQLLSYLPNKKTLGPSFQIEMVQDTEQVTLEFCSKLGPK